MFKMREKPLPGTGISCLKEKSRGKTIKATPFKEE
jgi:hypothetical protein